MLLDISDNHHDRANNHKSFSGPSVFELYNDPSFKTAPIHLSTRHVECGIDAIVRKLISGGTFNRETAYGLISSRHTYNIRSVLTRCFSYLKNLRR